MTAAVGLLLGASPAAGLTLGVGWVEPSRVGSEMPAVAESGAEAFRLPLPPAADNDGAVEAAARAEVTIHAEVSAGEELPTGAARAGFLAAVAAEVRRYGYGGQFWVEHPWLPYAPITSWEVGNEPNHHDIGPAEYGIYLGEVASAIQAASRAQAGHGTDVLSGGLLVWGTEGGAEGDWQARGPVSYQGALRYLEEAFPYFGASPDVTGVAIHPYELDPETFSGQSRIGAFEAVVAGFHDKLVELAPTAPKSLSVTEAGWPAEGQYGVGPDEQANLLRQAIGFASSNAEALGLRDFLWYNLRDPAALTNWTGFCGLRAGSGSYRPAWYAFQEAAGVELSGTQLLAFQGTDSRLWTYRSAGGYAATGLGMMAATSPSAAPVPRGGGLIAFQGNDGGLWLYSTVSGAGHPTGAAMAAATSPALAAVPGEGYAVAFQGSDGRLWTYSTVGGTSDTGLGMMAGTSPAVTALPGGGYAVAFEANDGELWLYDSRSGGGLGTGAAMAAGTSPSVAAVPGGGLVVAFQAGDGLLWTYATAAGLASTGLGMGPGTSPSVAALEGGGYVVGFQAGDGRLATFSPTAGLGATALAAAVGTSPSLDDSPDGAYVAALQAVDARLWTYAPVTGALAMPPAMLPGTGPSLVVR